MSDVPSLEAQLAAALERIKALEELRDVYRRDLDASEWRFQQLWAEHQQLVRALPAPSPQGAPDRVPWGGFLKRAFTRKWGG